KRNHPGSKLRQGFWMVFRLGVNNWGSIITRPQTTIEALGKLCGLLVKGGRIAIMIYYGHEGGDLERDAVLDFVIQLNQQEYTAAIYRTLNQVNNPPFLVMIEKLERYRHG
ncbi:class I SAM-dependent methyltransferase, partial [Streptococcus pneumoniae]